MHKSLLFGSSLLAGIMLLGSALGQQTPAASSQPSSPGQTSSGQSASGKSAASQPASGQTSSGQSNSGQTSTPAKKTTSTAAAKKPAAAAPLTLKTQKEKTSYAVGVNIGSGLKRQELPVDPAILARGLRDAMTGAKLALTDDEMKAVLTQLQTEMRGKQQEIMAKQQAAAKEAGAANRKEGESFLAANKGKEGVVTLPDGLQYKILKQGNGPKPTANDTVTCDYRGTLINGKEFDSSYKRGHPESFPVGGVIKGWTEALQMMPVGSKWQLFIPADLAYGDNPRGGDIQPGDTLIFEVELISIGEKK
jgi:FKBP-type peptidyl-prolyl cis-trans isomerase FklB